jgi:hypothetical protein
VLDNVVYVAGGTINSAGVHVPCYWENGLRTDLSVLDPAKIGSGSSVFVVGSDTYVSGYTKNSANVVIPCYWKNGKRTDLGETGLGDGLALSLVVKVTKN